MVNDRWITLAVVFGAVLCSKGENINDNGVYAGITNLTSSICESIPNYHYVRSLENCQYYYQCIDGVAYKLSCPQYYWFSEEHQRCGNRYEFECDLESTTPSQTPPAEPQNRCLGEPNFSFVSDHTYCHQFSMCLLDIPFPMVCWDELWFDSEQQSCIPPDESTCDASTPPPTDPPTTNVCNGVEDGERVLGSKYCNQYYECRNQTAIFTVCIDGLLFDEDRQECVHPVDAHCPYGVQNTPTPDVCNGVADGLLVASSNSCSVYYVCANNVGYRLFCPRDHFFDQNLQRCYESQDEICWIENI
ncbi:peritrophin-48-like [Toxorhynchites rutilus septentrionalis]|uniref:peritrophin-48-like n=1 Tax=Toxorhynchites rutilus septentrionalis TaxID=329112 RepID=UPI002478DEDD|nr:peritrophin-48-like [Toxorhynchites rutilus septentrionalis]